MRPEMRRLLRDFARRNAGWLLLIGFAQFLSALLYVGSSEPRMPFFGGAGFLLLLGQERHRSWTRAMLTLPVSLHDSGRVLWWASIGLPGIVFTGLNLSAVLMTVPFLGWKYLDLGQIALWIFATWGMLALFTLTPTRLRVGGGVRPSAAQIIVAGLTFPVMMMGVYGFPLTDPWPMIAGIVAVIGMIWAGYLYLRAERFALWQLGAPVSLRAAHRKQRSMRTSSMQFLGWIVIARRYGFSVLQIAGWILGLFVLLPLFSSARSQRDVLVILLALMFPTLMKPWLAAARAFRSLPLTADRLAAILLSMSLAPTGIFVSALLLACNSYDTCGPSMEPLLPFLLWPPSLYPPLWLRYAETKVEEVGIFLLLGLSAVFVGSIFAITKTSLLMQSLLTGAIVVAGFLWTRHELRAARRAYRRAKTGALSTSTERAEIL